MRVPPRTTLLALVGAAVAGCSDPTIEVRFEFPTSTNDAFKAAVTRYNLTVATLTDKTCDDVRMGRVSPEEIDLGRQTSIAAGRPASPSDAGVATFDQIPISGVPRLGPKFFIFTGYDAQNHLIAGACTQVDDIEDDTVITLDIEPSIVTRVLLGLDNEPSVVLGPAAPTRLFVARERWRSIDDAQSNLSAKLAVSFRTATCESQPYGSINATDVDAGVYTLGGLVAPAPSAACTGIGPVEVVLRSPWADQANRIPAVVPSAHDVVPLWLTEGDVNQIAPSWQIGSGPDGPLLYALFRGSAGTTQLVILQVSDGQLSRGRTFDAPGVTTLALFTLPMATKPDLVTRTASGWSRFDFASETFRPTTTETITPPDRLLTIPACGTDAPGADLGLLAMTGTTVEGFRTAAGPRALPGAPMGLLAAGINSAGQGARAIRLLGAACVSVSIDAGASLKPVVAVEFIRDTSKEIQLFLSPDATWLSLVSPFVGDVTIVDGGGRHFDLLGPVSTATGYRAVSYRLRVDGAATTLIPTGLIDHPLPGRPSSITAFDANDDGLVDTAALVPFGGTTGLSMTHGSDLPGGPLSAMVLADQDAPGALLRGFSSPSNSTTNQAALILAGPNGAVIYNQSRQP